MSNATTMPDVRETPAASPVPANMDVKVRIHSIKPEGSVRARCSVELSGCFAVRGVRLMDGPNGHFLSMPSYKVAEGYKDLCFPVTKEFRQHLLDAVENEYQQSIALAQTSGHQKAAGPEQDAQEATQQAPPFEAPGYDSGPQFATM